MFVRHHKPTLSSLVPPYLASDVAELLLQKGVIVRPCGGWEYDKHIRVSVGTHEQNEIFLEKLKEALEELAK